MFKIPTHLGVGLGGLGVKYQKIISSESHVKCSGVKYQKCFVKNHMKGTDLRKKVMFPTPTPMKVPKNIFASN